jgi:hypothetical protein
MAVSHGFHQEAVALSTFWGNLRRGQLGFFMLDEKNKKEMVIICDHANDGDNM